MKFLATTVVALMQLMGSQAQSGKFDMLQAAYEIQSGAQNVQAAIDGFEDGDVQPECLHPTGNVALPTWNLFADVFCISTPDDIDDTTFIHHPVVPSGTTLGDLVGTADYDLGKDMIAAVVDAVTDGGACVDTDNFGLAEYQWLSEADHSTPVTVTSFVKSFESGGESYICGTGPLAETPVETGDETEAMLEKEAETDVSVNMKNLQLIPDFQWEEAPEYADYDFVGNLEFCGGVANEIEWPEYFAEENISGAIFAYRQYGMSDLPCGDEMSPRLNLIPGKKYKINFINTSGSPTNLHTHGLHIGGNYYLDDVFRLVNPGECAIYIWDIIGNHASGYHWYHPHLHGWTFEQVRGRAFGPLFVEEIPEVVATYPASVQAWLKNEVFLQMSTDTVPSPMSNGLGVKDGRCPNTTAGEDDFTTCYPRINNKRAEHVTMIRNEWYNVIVHNVVPNGTGMDVIEFFKGDGMRAGDLPCEVMVTGYDGVYRSSVPRPTYPEDLGYFHCNGASRVHLAIKCSADATMKLAKEDITPEHYQMSTESDKIPVLAFFDVVDGPTTIASPYADEATLTPWIPPRPQYLEDLVSWTGDVETWESKTKIIGLETGDRMQMQPVFNDQIFHGGEANHVATFGQVQEWSFFGTAGAPDGHPMHVHVNHMQVYGNNMGVGRKGMPNEDDPDAGGFDCGANYEVGEWYDTLRIDNKAHDPCLARFRFNDYSGKVIMHCHDLMHEDGGMMGWVDVQGGPDDDTTGIVVESVDCMNIL